MICKNADILLISFRITYHLLKTETINIFKYKKQCYKMASTASYAFEEACVNGLSNLARQINNLYRVDIWRNDGAAFFEACARGHTEIIKLYHEINPRFFEEKDVTYGFNLACHNNHINIALFIASMSWTRRYYVTIEEGYIVDHGVRETLKYVAWKEIDKAEDCPVCLEKKSDVVTDCNHQFCRGCIETWYKDKKNCPLCRNHIKTVQFLKLYKKTSL